MSRSRQKEAILPLPRHYKHSPPIHATRFKGTSECGRYGDFVHELDWIVGEVTNILDELDLADNTLVVFTSDNGGMLNEGGQDAWRSGHRLNSNLLGFKFGAWEGGHRVPFIVRWPGKVQQEQSRTLVGQIDLITTFAEAAGAILPQDKVVDGVVSYQNSKELRRNLLVMSWSFRPTALGI